MLSQKVEYFAPNTLEEACFLATKYKEEAKIIAGGTDLVLQMKHKEVLPKYIINISNVTGYNDIIFDENNGLRIGALSTIHSIETSSLIRNQYNILSQAASKLGSKQVRIGATIGGNLCNAAPSADTIPALMVLDAKIKIMGLDTHKIISIEEFFSGPRRTVLKAGEVLEEIQIPNLPSQYGGVYIKQTVRKAMDLSIIGVAALVIKDGNIISDVRIALGTAAPTVIRVRRAEQILKGNSLNNGLLEKVGQMALEESNPRDSLRSSAEYRSELIKVLVPRAIKQAMEQIEAR